MNIQTEFIKMAKQLASKNEKLEAIKRMIVAAQDEDTYPENLPAVVQMILEETEDDDDKPKS